LRAELKKRSFYGFSLEVLVKREPRRGFMIRFSVARLTVSVAVAAFAAAAMGFSGAMGPWTSTLLGLTTFPGLLFLLELGDRSAEIERERLLQVRTQQAEAWLERELQLLIALYADQKQRAERAVARTSERQLPLFQDTGVRHEARPN
jgi:hypothetical protein